MALGLAHINLTLTGAADQFTATPTWVRWFSCLLSSASVGTVAYVGDSAVTGATDCTFETPKGQMIAITPSVFADNHVGDQYDLSQLYVVGTADDIFTIAYELVTG